MQIILNKLIINNRSFLFFIITSFVNGGLLTLAFAPFHFIFAALISFLFLIYLIEFVAQRSFLQRLFFGFFYGLGHFATSLYWIAYSLSFEPEKFAWLIPFSVTLIPSLMAFFIGLFTVWISYFIKSGISRSRVCFVFASSWVLIEFCRSHAIFPFPWNLLGYTGFFSIYFVQIASVIGVYGLSFLIVLGSVIFYSKKWLLISGVYSCIALCFFYGYLKLGEFDTTRRGEEKVTEFVKVRMVQPNFQELYFGKEEKKLGNLLKLVEMSNKDGYQDRDLIIWPESAYPFIIQENDIILKNLTKVLKSNASLVFGADRYINHFGTEKLYNSMFSLNKSKGILDIYDKKILVPFGEYVPFRQVLPFLDKVVGGNLEFSLGQTFHQLMIDKVGAIIPLICFEIIFDSLYNNALIKNALFILNITNDLWFCDSIGPYQHLAMSRMRAIEYGLPLVRVANTGISAIIDCYGRMLVVCELNTESISDYDLKIKRTFSIYTKYGLKFIVLDAMALIVGFNIMIIFLKRKKNIKHFLKK